MAHEGGPGSPFHPVALCTAVPCFSYSRHPTNLPPGHQILCSQSHPGLLPLGFHVHSAWSPQQACSSARLSTAGQSPPPPKSIQGQPTLCPSPAIASPVCSVFHLPEGLEPGLSSPDPSAMPSVQTAPLLLHSLLCPHDGVLIYHHELVLSLRPASLSVVIPAVPSTLQPRASSQGPLAAWEVARALPPALLLRTLSICKVGVAAFPKGGLKTSADLPCIHWAL